MVDKKITSQLFKANPELVKHWDFDANNGPPAQSLVPGSASKANWICDLRHHFSSEVRRQAKGFSCPYCLGRRVLAGFNDLATVNPELASEWDYSKNDPVLPTEVTAGASMKAHWLCKFGHSFQTQIAIRKRGVGCPVCAGQKVWPGFNDLKTKHPTMAQEWDLVRNEGIKPSEVLAGGETPRHWICSKGHSYKLSIKDRIGGQGCQFCAGRLILAGFNDLATVNPELAAEWDYVKNAPLTPQDVTSGSGKTVSWVCPEGHPFEAKIAYRSRTKCPICAGQKVLPGENDLGSTNPELAAEWDYVKNAPLTPQDVTSGSGKQVHWICARGHSSSSSVNNRNSGKKCPFCSGSLVIPGETDLGTVNPSLAREWDYPKNYPLEPKDVFPKSARRVAWICANNHSYSAIISSRSNGTGCPYCGGWSILSGWNDLATVRPALAAEWDFAKNGSMTPDSVGVADLKAAHWICPQGHSYEQIIAYRAQAGCPQCSGRKVIVGINDLATINPALAKEWDFEKNGELTPMSVSAGSGKKVFWICDQKHSYDSVIVARMRGNGCPACAQSGYNPSMSGLFYLISNPQLRARKIGITNPDRKSDRLAGYGQTWEVLATWYSEDGLKVQQLETLMLRWLRKDLGLPAFLGRSDMGKNGGHSETFSLDNPGDEEVVEKAELLIEELGMLVKPYNPVRTSIDAS